MANDGADTLVAERQRYIGSEVASIRCWNNTLLSSTHYDGVFELIAIER
ncbi:MAG: hypothetical protein ACI8SJ_001733 [Shewanella sp.]|jgi:hypothetical protein